jgi:hypothetical protein
MATTIPNTGQAISFGQVNKAFTGNLPGAVNDAPVGGKNIKLSAVLGVNPVYGIGQVAKTQIKFSATFGGKIGPFTV